MPDTVGEPTLIAGSRLPDSGCEVVIVEEAEAGNRLDLLLARRFGVTRSFIKSLVERGSVETATSKKIKAGIRVAAGQAIRVCLPAPAELDLDPEEVPFRVIYEDRHLLVIDKPSGIVVHPAPGNWRGTLVHGLLHRYSDWGEFNSVRRPGIVHRLDAPTSGLLVVARDQWTLDRLQQQFKERQVKKIYLALTEGVIRHPSGVISLPIGRSSSDRLRMAVDAAGKPASTEFKVLWRTENNTFIQCRIPTGRTHQIRVHLAHIGRPILGDALYGSASAGKDIPGRLFLHSWKLSFRHPVTEETVSFTCPLPLELISQLRDILSKGRG